MNWKLLVLFLCVISLSGCGWFGEREIVIQPLEPVTLNLPEISPVDLDSVEWKIITRDNQESVFTDLEKDGQDPVLFGLTDKYYESLSINFAKLRAYIKQQNKVIEIYKNYYEETEKLKEQQ